MSYSSGVRSGGVTSFPYASERTLRQIIIEKQADLAESVNPGTCSRNETLLLGAKHDPQRADDRNHVRSGACSALSVVQDGALRSNQTMSDDLRLARPQIPPLN